MSEGHKFSNAGDALQFMQAGNATVTLRSVKTGTRFTYRVRESDDGKVFFVGLLTGSDNNASYSYMGILRDGEFRTTAKSKITADAPSAKAFRWAYAKLGAGMLPADLEVWHEGRCGKCGRRLTVPESIAAGIGPECAGRLGGGELSSPELRGMGTSAGRKRHKANVKAYNAAMQERPNGYEPIDTSKELPDDGVSDLFTKQSVFKMSRFVGKSGRK